MIYCCVKWPWGFPGGSVGKESTCHTGESESESEVAQSCPTLCDPMDCSSPGSSVHGILQATILEWGAISFSRRSSRSRDRTQVSCIAGRRFNLWPTKSCSQCVYILLFYFQAVAPARQPCCHQGVIVCCHRWVAKPTWVSLNFKMVPWGSPTR